MRNRIWSRILPISFLLVVLVLVVPFAWAAVEWRGMQVSLSPGAKHYIAPTSMDIKARPHMFWKNNGPDPVGAVWNLGGGVSPTVGGPPAAGYYNTGTFTIPATV